MSAGLYELGFQDVRELRAEELSCGLADMQPEKARRVSAMRNIEERNRSIAADILARKMLAKKLGLIGSCVPIKTEPNGKPYLDGLPFHFSISHSGHFAVCAVSEWPVGVDIEELRLVPDSVLRRFFTDREREYASGDDCGLRALQLWTRKEAFAKLCGSGIVAQRGIELLPGSENSSGCLFEYIPVDGYVCCVCLRPQVL